MQDLASDARGPASLTTHSTVSSISTHNSSPCQYRPFETSEGNMICNFPPPYTETCSISPRPSDEVYFHNQGLADRILYELDSQYLNQLLPLNTAPDSNDIPSCTNPKSYINSRTM